MSLDVSVPVGEPHAAAAAVAPPPAANELPLGAIAELARDHDRYEYQLLHLPKERQKDPALAAELEPRLNALGTQGWALAGVLRAHLILMRRERA